MDRAAFARRLQSIRKKKNISVQDLARIAGVSVPHLRAMETGKRLPGLEVFIRLVNAFGISADELLAGNVKTALPLVLNNLTQLMKDMPQEQLTLIETCCIALKKT